MLSILKNTGIKTYGILISIAIAVFYYLNNKTLKNNNENLKKDIETIESDKKVLIKSLETREEIASKVNTYQEKLDTILEDSEDSVELSVDFDKPFNLKDIK